MLDSEVITALGWTLLHSTWQISLVAFFMLLFLRINKNSSRFRYNIIASGLLSIPFISAATFLYYFNQLNVHLSSAHEDFLIDPTGNVVLEADVSLTDQITAAVNNYSSFPVLLWLLGISILLIRFTGGLYYTHKLRKTGLIKVTEKIDALVEQLRLKAGVAQKISIFESVMVNVPLTIGHIKPFILLPAGTIAGIPPQQLEAILAHEIAHIRRMDYFHNILNTLIEIIFFYHPAVWWITDRLNQERENCCDDIAISLTGDKLGFVHALAGINKIFSHPQHALAMTGKQNHLLNRIKRLAGIKESSHKLTYHSYLFLTITALAAGVAFSVNASVHVPDNLNLSSGIASEFLLDKSYEAVNIQDTTKTKKKKLPAPAKSQKKETSDDSNKKNELTKEQREKLESEMKKLEAEMKKLEEQMKDLHKHLGLTEWKNFDFKFDFNYDSLTFKINQDIAKEMAMIKIYTDQAVREANLDSLRARIYYFDGKARADADRAVLYERLKADKEKRKAKAEAEVEVRRANKKLIEAEKEMHKANVKRIQIKADSEKLEEELRKDGLIKDKRYKLRMDNTGMYVDDKKLSDEQFQKYKKLLFEDANGDFTGDENFNIYIQK